MRAHTHTQTDRKITNLIKCNSAYIQQVEAYKVKKEVKRDPKMILLYSYFLNLKCSKASRESVGHFGLNSLSSSRARKRAPSLLFVSPCVSIKEAAFCDLQIKAGHVTRVRCQSKRGLESSHLKRTPLLYKLQQGVSPYPLSLTRI